MIDDTDVLAPKLFKPRFTSTTADQSLSTQRDFNIRNYWPLRIRFAEYVLKHCVGGFDKVVALPSSIATLLGYALSHRFDEACDEYHQRDAELLNHR